MQVLEGCPEECLSTTHDLTQTRFEPARRGDVSLVFILYRITFSDIVLARYYVTIYVSIECNNCKRVIIFYLPRLSSPQQNALMVSSTLCSSLDCSSLARWEDTITRYRMVDRPDGSSDGHSLSLAVR